MNSLHSIQCSHLNSTWLLVIDMELKLYRILIALLLLGAVGFGLFWHLVPGTNSQHQHSTTPSELIGHNFHWRYENGWDFHVQIQDGVLHWEGVASDFEGIQTTVKPHFRQIREDLYFITWPLTVVGFDSLVLDLEAKQVFAHSKANAKFFSLQGEVYCDGRTEQCMAPKGL